MHNVIIFPTQTSHTIYAHINSLFSIVHTPTKSGRLETILISYIIISGVITLILSLSCSTLMLASSSCCCSSLSLICITLKASLKPSTSAPSPLDTAGAALANHLIFSWILSLDPNWSILATHTKCHVLSEYSEYS